MTFIACYDLARCPPTYDVVTFLGHVERERVNRGESDVHIRILPGPKDGFRGDKLWPYTTSERIRMRDNVCLPICRLLPSADVKMVTTNRNRYSGCFGFNEYKISLPSLVPLLKSGPWRPLRHFDGLVERHPKMITFTLRESEHHKPRNSKLVEWLDAAADLKLLGWDVVIIRDTAQADNKLRGYQVSSIASTDLFSRASLYSRARVNVGINNGPMWLAIMMNAPVIMMRPTTDIGGCYDDKFYASCGLPPGSQLPNSPPHQRLVWRDDTADNIVRAVSEHVEELAE